MPGAGAQVAIGVRVARVAVWRRVGTQSDIVGVAVGAEAGAEMDTGVLVVEVGVGVGAGVERGIGIRGGVGVLAEMNIMGEGGGGLEVSLRGREDGIIVIREGVIW